MASDSISKPHDASQFSVEDFEPLKQREAKTFFSNETSGYWKQAWQKLKRNHKAMASLYVIIFLVLFSSFGPLFWTLDAARQDLNQLSQAPALQKKALVVDSLKVWQPALSVTKSLKLDVRLHEVAHTESIKLIWNVYSSASYYEVFRHEYRPTGINDLGLPLYETENGFESYYEDKLKLEDRAYYYSIVARDSENQILARETYFVRPELAVQNKQAEENIKRGVWQAFNRTEESNVKVLLPAHPMGTDYLGRDMMARLMYGGRTSLVIALLASLLFVVVGSFYGALSAYIGGSVDNALMRFADFVIALPFLLFMILLKVSFGVRPGESGIAVMVFSLIVLSWPASARLVRGQVLLLREQNFIMAARINGAGTFYILFKHLLPNVLSVILVSLSFAIPSVILTEAFLSFIGLGVVPPTPSWGAMCQEGIKTFLFYPHELIFPASFIGITVLAFNLLGDGLRDAFDVKVE
jgi:oligopeptide transport system permease protein